MTYDNKEIEVEILTVDKENSSITIKNSSGEEGDFRIVGPADVKYARVGKAVVKFLGDDLNYVKSLEPKRESNFKPFKPNYNNSNTNKPSGFRQFNQKNNLDSFKPKEDIPYHYKVKRQFLEKVTYDVAEKAITVLESEGFWIFATNYIPRNEFEDSHMLYDVIIFIKQKEEGMRNGN